MSKHNNKNLSVIYPKRIEAISPEWINRSKFIFIVGTISMVLISILFAIFIIIFIIPFKNYLIAENIIIQISTIFSIVFLLKWIFIGIFIGFSYRSFKSRELNKSLIILYVGILIGSIGIVLDVVLIVYTAITMIYFLGLTGPNIINLPIFGNISLHNGLSIMYGSLSILVIATLSSCIYLGIGIYYISKYGFLKRIVWNNYNSKYQWINFKKEDQTNDKNLSN